MYKLRVREFATLFVAFCICFATSASIGNCRETQVAGCLISPLDNDANGSNGLASESSPLAGRNNSDAPPS